MPAKIPPGLPELGCVPPWGAPGVGFRGLVGLFSCFFKCSTCRYEIWDAAEPRCYTCPSQQQRPNLPALCRCTINALNNGINPYYTTPTHRAEAMTEFFNYFWERTLFHVCSWLYSTCLKWRLNILGRAGEGVTISHLQETILQISINHLCQSQHDILLSFPQKIV